MTRGVALTLALSVLWAAGSVWYYDCKIKRVCGPGDAVQAAPAPVGEAAAAPPATAPPPFADDLQVDETLSRLPANTAAPDADAPKADPAGLGMLLLRVRFDPKSAEPVLPADAEQSLATLRSLVAEGAKLRIVGHSDSRGERARIAVVSQQRAQMLREWLVARGVPGEAVAAIESEDDRVPLASNDTAEGRARNRRAEVWLQPE